MSDDFDDEFEPDEPIELPIEESIDLHPFAATDVRFVVEDYLIAAHEKGFREVRLIHGKGIGTQKRIIRALLERHPLVASFRDAPDANWGATVVLLKED